MRVYSKNFQISTDLSKCLDKSQDMILIEVA